jgi:DNA repair ATPase RecN
MDHFITIRAGGTTYGQYKQALRELVKRYKALKTLYIERELLLLDITELEERKTDERRSELELARERMKMEDIDATIRDTTREFRRFYMQADSLKKELPQLNEATRARLDEEMWEHQIKKMAAIESLTAGRVGPKTVEMIQCLPAKLRAKLFELCCNREKIQELHAWFWTVEQPLPKLSGEVPDVEALLGVNSGEVQADRQQRISAGDSV